MEKLGRFIIKNRKKIALLTIIISIFSIYQSSKLEIKMEITDLLPKNSQKVHDYNYALDNFDNLDITIVGAKGKKENIISFIENTSMSLKKNQYIDSIRYKTEGDYLLKNFFLIEKNSNLEKLEKSFYADNIQEFLYGINDNFEKGYIDESDNDQLSKDKLKLLYFFNYLEDFLTALIQGDLGPKEADEFFTGQSYFLSPDENLGIFFIKSNLTIDQMDLLADFINNLEKDLKKEGEKYGVEVLLTGPQVLSRDEFVQTQKDTKLTSSLSLILIFLLFLKAFSRVRYSLLSIIPLSLGILVALAATKLLYGKLNMMTAMMGAILIGLGIDYAIHMITIYLEYRYRGSNREEAVMMIFRKGLKGIAAGAMTTAIGFLLFGLSSFPGFSEFGVVLGSGIIIVFLVTVFLLPTLLMYFGKIKNSTRGEVGLKYFDLIEEVIGKRKKSVFLLCSMLIIFLSYNAKNIEFDKNMMNIQMKDLPSLTFNEEIIDEFDMSSDNTIAVSSTITEAFDLKEKLDLLKTVGEIDTIANYLTPKEQQHDGITFIKKLKNEIKPYKNQKINKEALTEELIRLEKNIIELSDLAYMGGEEKLYTKADSFVERNIIGQAIESLELKEPKTSDIFIKRLKENINNSNDNYIGIENLNTNIKKDYIGKDGHFITTIYPKGNFWNVDFQKLHRSELNTIEERLTGTTLIFLEVVDAEIKEGRRVLIYTFIGIYLILLIDLKSLKYSILTILPMFAAVSSTFGLLALIGYKLNMVNIIGIPLIVGIGVDDGVHIIHRYLLEKSLKPALHSTGRAVLTTTLTTMAAFGTMIIAKYRGFSTFGLLLITGVFFAYFYTIVFMIALLAIIDRKEEL